MLLFSIIVFSLMIQFGSRHEGIVRGDYTYQK